MKRDHNKGYLLIEALIAVTVMCGMLAAIAGVINQSVHDIQLAGEYTAAACLVQKTLETLETNQDPWLTNPSTYEMNNTEYIISWTTSIIVPGLQGNQAFVYWNKRGKEYSVQAETYQLVTH